MFFPALLLALATVFPVDRPDDTAERVLTAQPVTQDLHIDGRLDEPDWQTAPVATGFRQSEPVEGAPPSFPTEVRVLYGSRALYIGAHLQDEAPEKILPTLGRRDDDNQADWFFASIDSYFDRKTAYTFGLNAAGVQLDGITTRDLDLSWDAVWDGAARIVADGWIVEMRIPYAMLRFSSAEEQTWGINFRRVIPRLSETHEWALVLRSEREGGVVARYGQLQGLSNVRPLRNLQLTPYSVSRLSVEKPDAVRTLQRSFDAGGDLKLGLSSNLTLDATFNPDFGQVESDPAELNLTAFETFFPERRPFFVEGAQIFNFGLDREGSMLYTRRIGANAPIIGAAKFSGRTNEGLSFGLLSAATGEKFDPSRLYGVARLRQELGRYSYVGALATGFDQRDEALTDTRSTTGGLDWDFRLKQNRYSLDGNVLFSHRNTEGISETGFGVATGFDKVRGVWTWSSGFRLLSDGFNINDVGRLRRNDLMRFNVGVGHQIHAGQPFGPFQQGSARLFTWQNVSYRERLNQGQGFFLLSEFLTRGFQSVELTLFTDYLIRGYDLYETRGLGPRLQPREGTLSLEFETDSRRAWQLAPELRVQYNAEGGLNYETALEADWNTGSRLQLTGGVGYTGEADMVAWASNEAFARTDTGWAIGTESTSPDAVETFEPFDAQGQLEGLLAGVLPYDAQGRFYLPVFGARTSQALDLTLRSNITFSPRLSLQLYSQLFVARGQYTRFQLLKDRDTLADFAAYPKRHDFGLNSFQTNLVLRWEYRPGSTLFLVWSQARRNDTTISPFDLTGTSPFDRNTLGQLSDTFDLFPTNVFLLKLNYLFMR
jgi:hypothetical protein